MTCQSTCQIRAALGALPAVAALALAVPVAAAHADAPQTQNAAPPSPPPDGSSPPAERTSLEPVLVTARHKPEALFEVPIAVTVVGEHELDAWHVGSLRDVGESAPNTLFQKQGGSATTVQYNIRGVAAGGTSPQLDSGVALYLDGLYIGRAANTVLGMWDVDRVEVLRGPQGTLFGRNATGGAINVTTSAPQGSLGGTVRQGVGNYGLTSTQLAVDTPTVAGLSARLALSHSEHAGYTRNTAPQRTVDFGPDFGAITTHDSFDDERSDSAKLALRYTGVPGLTLDYKLFHMDWQGTQPARQLVTLDPADAARIKFDQQPSLPGGGTHVIDTRPLDALPGGLDSPSKYRAVVQGFNAQYRVDDKHRFVFVAGQSRYDSRSGGNGIDGNAFVDPQGSGRPTFLTFSLNNVEQSQLTQDLQWQASDGGIDWLLGLFSSRERIHSNNPVMSSSLGQTTFDPVHVITDADYRLGSDSLAHNDSLAAYGNASLPLGNWVLAVGLRHSRDQREEDIIRGGLSADGSDIRFRGLVASYSGSKTNFDLSGSYRLDTDSRAYLRYATGYLAGGTLLGQPFGAEDIASAEAGLKAELARSLSINAAVFVQQRRHLQAQIFDIAAGGYRMLNAGTGRSQGLELELHWQAGEALRIDASYGLIAVHNQNGVRPLQPRQTAFLAAEWKFVPWSSGARPSVQFDTSLRSAISRPECPLGTTADPLQGCTQLQNADWALDRRARIPGFATIGLRGNLAGVHMPGQMLGRISLWVRNLSDRRQREYMFSLGNKTSLATFSAPRTAGLDLALDF